MTQTGGFVCVCVCARVESILRFFFLLTLQFALCSFKITPNLHKLFIITQFSLWFHISFSSVLAFNLEFSSAFSSIRILFCLWNHRFEPNFQAKNDISRHNRPMSGQNILWNSYWMGGLKWRIHQRIEISDQLIDLFSFQ